MTDPAIQKLVDRRWEIKHQLDRLTEELEPIDKTLKLEDIAEGEILEGSNGYGYRVGVTRKRVYDEEARRYAAAFCKDALPELVSLTTTKLKDLYKAGKITAKDSLALDERSHIAEQIRLYEYVLEEVKELTP